MQRNTQEPKAQPLHLTRLAPTPSGFLHLGNVLSFAITTYFAHRHGSKIWLRIDDLDTDRIQQEYVEDIFDSLKFLNLPWHIGPPDSDELKTQWSQLHRSPEYNQVLQTLADNGHVFACTCSRAQIAKHGSLGYPGTCLHKNIPLDSPGVQWRIKTDASIQMRMQALKNKDYLSVLPQNMQHFVVRRKDGYPTYQLSSLTDDVAKKVELIVRGEDLWESSWAQLYLATVLEKQSFLNVKFLHHPLIKSEDGNKLSKSAGSESIQFLRKTRVSAEDIYQDLARKLKFSQSCRNWQELGECCEKYLEFR